MMHIFLNCLAASAGSGLTYVRNVVPQLAAQSNLRVTICLGPQLRNELGSPANVSFIEKQFPAGAAARFCLEQLLLPRLIRESGADVLISAGNIALRKPPVPQILLSGNSLYTSPDFFADLRERRAYRICLDTKVRGFFAHRSVRWADCTVAPSQAFAATLRAWTGANVASVYHGFDREVFFRDPSPLPIEIQQELDAGNNALRIIFVSHYNYYRNFETLLRAIPLIRERLGRNVQLFLTCRLSPDEYSGPFRTEPAAALVKQLGISNQVVELGAVPYRSLHRLLRACDIYVSPAYTETFAHPLVEAMACGLPVVASDLPVHREICGTAANYFPRFSPQTLADCVAGIEGSSALRKQLADNGLKRAQDFSWRSHVDQIVALAQSLKPGKAEHDRAA